MDDRMDDRLEEMRDIDGLDYGGEDKGGWILVGAVGGERELRKREDWH